VDKLLQAEGMSQSKIHRRLLGVYGQNAFSGKEITAWCKKFKDIRTALSDDPEINRGRPRTSHTGENCTIFEGLVREGGISECVERIAKEIVQHFTSPGKDH
jgi:hypothetical protein